MPPVEVAESEVKDWRQQRSRTIEVQPWMTKVFSTDLHDRDYAYRSYADPESLFGHNILGS